MSTDVQSLELSIQGSMKLGPVKISRNHYLRCGLPKSLFQLFSCCLTQSQCFLGHQGPSWTTVYMSPLIHIRADLKKWSELDITLEREIFIKEYVLLIRLSSTIFTGAVWRILVRFQPRSWLCIGHRDPNNFCSKSKYLIVSQILHSLTKSHYQKHILLWWCMLGTHSTFIIHFADNPEHFNWNAMCLRATATLLSKITSPKILGRCANAKWFHNLQIDCSWMLAICPYQAYFPSKFSISELNWLDLNCLDLDLGDFQMSPFQHGIKSQYPSKEFYSFTTRPASEMRHRTA